MVYFIPSESVCGKRQEIILAAVRALREFNLGGHKLGSCVQQFSTFLLFTGFFHALIRSAKSLGLSQVSAGLAAVTGERSDFSRSQQRGLTSSWLCGILARH